MEHVTQETILGESCLSITVWEISICITWLTNIHTGLDLTDATICYRLLTRESLALFRDRLTADDFGIDPELIAYIAHHKLRLFEVGVSYYARNKSQGKKIYWRDGVRALWYMLKYNHRARRVIYYTPQILH